MFQTDAIFKQWTEDQIHNDREVKQKITEVTGNEMSNCPVRRIVQHLAMHNTEICISEWNRLQSVTNGTQTDQQNPPAGNTHWRRN